MQHSLRKLEKFQENLSELLAIEPFLSSRQGGSDKNSKHRVFQFFSSPLLIWT